MPDDFKIKSASRGRFRAASRLEGVVKMPAARSARPRAPMLPARRAAGARGDPPLISDCEKSPRTTRCQEDAGRDPDRITVTVIGGRASGSAGSRGEAQVAPGDPEGALRR